MKRPKPLLHIGNKQSNRLRSSTCCWATFKHHMFDCTHFWVSTFLFWPQGHGSSFAPHRQVGWYIEPSPAHYPCHRVHLPDTMVEFNVLKVDVFPGKTISICITYFIPQTDCGRLTPQSQAPLHKQSSHYFWSTSLYTFTKVAAILEHACEIPLSN